ncbi:MAG TPA: Re/Si-specific NAD(P)(+) transhydrogenase subunit alpha [Polyangiaceae bacterium LLY-WYZ-14_1]|nr:Re/Si-specific NAD(P)(+) transhydrogenase subunit alpha [Polyangiaceae bacterium LLY-WYZ-14_1]
MGTLLVPRERADGETRVAVTPETVKRLAKIGWEVVVESGAGDRSHLLDAAYKDAGARVVDKAGKEDWGAADAVAKVGPPTENDALGGHEADALKEGALLVGFLAPHARVDAVRKLRDGKVSALSMELVPRITRAQSMDALSSQASIGGYKAVLLAATHLGKYFPLLMTAAGTVQPARVVIMGAGVAGLQAIATAKRLGAIVEVSDIRPEVKEQVESLGGRFIELPMEESGSGEGGYAKEVSADFLKRQQEIVRDHVVNADVVITTALVPGRPAPRLVTKEMVEGMRPGAVIVDMAVEQGGNCELSAKGEVTTHQGVILVGLENLPATVPSDASLLYARNVAAVLELVTKDDAVSLDLDDEIVSGALLTHQGEVRHAPTAEKLGPSSPEGTEPS